VWAPPIWRCDRSRASPESSSISGSRAFVGAFAATLALALIGALAASEIVLRRHVIPFDGFEHARERFLTGNADIAAFGDSRVENGLAANGALANFGAASDSLATVLGKAEAWQARNPDGRLVIALAPQQFSGQRLGADQTELLEDFVSDDAPLLQVLRRAHRRYLLQYVGTVLRDPAILWRTPQPPSAGEGGGASFAERPPAEQTRFAQQRSLHHTPVVGFDGTAMARALRERLLALQDAGARLCLVTMPVSAAYRAAVAAEPRFDEVRRFYAALAREAGIRYIDLWDIYPDALFRDPDHLHPRGARQITQDILPRCFPE
jgi:hypothetical protein